MKPLFLVGYMGCGKSTMGRKLAHRLHARFVDTDAEVEAREGLSVYDIFQYAGEETFRRIEREVLESSVEQAEPLVISTGGGLPAWRDNMEWMNRMGHTVYLKRSAEQIAGRLSPYGRQKRPRLRGLSDEELVDFMRRDMAAREPFYIQARQCIDCAEHSDAELIEIILQAMPM